MATVNVLLRELNQLEADTKAKLAGQDPAIEQAVRCGFAIARVAATQAILDLSVKGIIPDGRGGRIMDEVKQAIDESAGRTVPKA